MKHKTTEADETTANQTVRLDLGTKDGVKSMRIGFTGQRLTAHGGLAVWTRFITERGLRQRVREVLPHTPSSLNAYDPCDTTLTFARNGDFRRFSRVAPSERSREVRVGRPTP